MDGLLHGYLGFFFPFLSLKDYLFIYLFIYLLAVLGLFFPTLFLFFFLLKDNCFTDFFLFSVKPQHESAIGIHMFPPF